MFRVAEKYLLTKESYRPLALDFFDKINPNRSEESKQLESYKMMVNEVTNKLYDNFVDKFIVHYFIDHPDLKLEEYSELLGDDRKLQKYIDSHIPNLREILEGYAKEYLNSRKKQSK